MSHLRGFSSEEIQTHRLPHFIVATRCRMDSVATIEWRIDQIWMFRILHDLVEVDHRIEGCLRADPCVDLVPDLRLRRAPSGITVNRRTIVSWDDRDADDSRTAPLHPPDDVLHAGDHLCRTSLPTDIVRSHEQHDVGDALMGKHVTLEPFDARR